MVGGKPLAGSRVIDLTRFVSGSYATMFLGALGANVLKIEVPPEGDPYRAQGSARVGTESAIFLSLNNDKKSVALDFRRPETEDVVERLLASADFLVENARPGSLEKYRLDYESVHARHAHLIYASISGFGDVGPEASRGGFDLILQAESGVMSVTGTEATGPVKVGAPLLDVGAGLAAVVGMLGAYIERGRTGEGTHVTSSLYHFALAGLTTLVADYLASGEPPGLLGTHSPTFAPYGAFRARNHWLVLAGTGSEQLWRKLCTILERRDLLDDPRLASNADRVQHRTELTEEIEEALAREDAETWVQRLRRAGIPAGSVRLIPDVVESEQARALAILRDLHHEVAGPYRAVALPLRWEGHPVAPESPAPILGAHTREVLLDLGLSTEDINRLVTEGMAVTP